MKRQAHLQIITQTPQRAQSPAGLFLDMVTQVIDRLLLAQRQGPWKATGPGDSTTDTGTGTSGTTGDTGVFNDTDI